MKSTLSDREIEKANERGRLYGLTHPRAVAARYDAANGIITVDLNRGFSVSFHKSRSQVLHNASDEQLETIEVQNPGSEVWFPALEDGFTVEGMLAGRFGTRRWEREWADANGIEIAENALPETVIAA